MSELHDAVRKRIAQIHYDIFDNGYSSVHGMDHIMQALAPLLDAAEYMRDGMDNGIPTGDAWDAAVAAITKDERDRLRARLEAAELVCEELANFRMDTRAQCMPGEIDNVYDALDAWEQGLASGAGENK